MCPIVIFRTNSKAIIDCNTAQNANQLIMTSLIDIYVEATRSNGKFMAYQLGEYGFILQITAYDSTSSCIRYIRLVYIVSVDRDGGFPLNHQEVEF